MFITGVLAVAGVLSVMNTMFAAISHRTKDVALLRVLGFARWQILVSFLLEALALGLVGGTLGCGLGYLADGWTFTTMIGSAVGGGTLVVLELVVDGDTLAVGLLVTAAMAILDDLLPALSATRLKPLEAFRQQGG